MSAGHPNLSPGDPIHVYIDHSNLTIGGDTFCQYHDMGHLRPWHYDIKALRHMIMQNLDLIGTANLGSVLLNIYGADLKNNTQIELFCKKGEIRSVFECPRNGNGKEKEADTQLTADMQARVSDTHSFLRDNYSRRFLQTNYAQSFPGQCVFVVISSDADMIPAVRSAANAGFYVHVWAWKSSISPLFWDTRNQLADPERIRIHYLDNHVQELSEIHIRKNRDRREADVDDASTTRPV
ncbi:hypothetical protein ACHAP8_011345 [Fusarium lateritium]